MPYASIDTICIICYNMPHFDLQQLLMPAPQVLSNATVLRLFSGPAGQWLALRDIIAKMGDAGIAASRATVQRRLAELVTAGDLVIRGAGPAREYQIVNRGTANLTLPELSLEARVTAGPRWSVRSQELLGYLQLPRAKRTPVAYQAGLVEDYVPSETFFLPESLRAKLAAVGQSTGERPAGTYARDILGQLLIDLSWSSSRLEGNRYSRLETKALIEAAHEAEGKTRQEAVMVLNHKRAIEFLVDVAPNDDPYRRVIANLHAMLMDGLMKDESGLGAIRHRLVVIEESTYTPPQAPAQLQRMYEMIAEKAQRVRDPLEASFFLLTQLPYLQPFEDGNKRTARVACNLPLAKANFAPLAFLDVNDQDYFYALMAIYEKADVSVMVDLFEWGYLRSVANFSAVKQAMAEPDAFRTRMRQQLSQAMQQVVVAHVTADAAAASLDIAPNDRERLARLVEHELQGLNELNHARYGLTFSQFDAWNKADKNDDSK